MMKTENVTCMDSNFTSSKILTAQSTLKIYEIADHKRKLLHELDAHSYTTAKFLTKSDAIAAVTKNNELVIIQDQKQVVETVKICDKNIADCLGVFYSENPLVLLGMSDGSVKAYECSGKLQHPRKLTIFHKNGVTNIAANGKCIITSGEDKMVNVTKLDITKDFLQTNVFSKGFEEEIVDVAICRDDLFDILLFAVCLPHEIYVFSSKISEPVQCIQVIPIKNAGGVQFTKAGYCIVAINTEGLKTFAPNEDGKYVEVPVELVDQ